MKVSVKARYGLAAMIYLAQRHSAGECVTVISLSDKLKISKIYLEQVFSLLKRSGLVISTKGAQGGYQLARRPREITACDIMSAIETAMFEKTSQTVAEGGQFIEETMHALVFDALDSRISEVLSGVSLAELAAEAEKRSSDDGYMYYL